MKRLTFIVAAVMAMTSVDANAQGWLNRVVDVAVGEVKGRVKEKVREKVNEAVEKTVEKTAEDEEESVRNEEARVDDETTDVVLARKGNDLTTVDFCDFLHYCNGEEAGPTLAVFTKAYCSTPAFEALNERVFNAVMESPKVYEQGIQQLETIIKVNKESGEHVSQEQLDEWNRELKELREKKRNARPVDYKAILDEILNHAVGHRFFWAAQPMFDGLVSVRTMENVEKGWGVINSQGKTVIPFQYSDICFSLFGEDEHMNVILGFNPDVGMSVYRPDGSLITPQKFWGGYLLPLNTIVVNFTKNTCGLLDEKTGKVLTTQKYEEIKDNLSNLLDSNSVVIYGVRNGKNYILSRDGREIGELIMTYDTPHQVIFY